MRGRKLDERTEAVACIISLRVSTVHCAKSTTRISCEWREWHCRLRLSLALLARNGANIQTLYTLKLLLIAATNFSDYSEKPYNR